MITVVSGTFSQPNSKVQVPKMMLFHTGIQLFCLNMITFIILKTNANHTMEVGNLSSSTTGPTSYFSTSLSSTTALKKQSEKDSERAVIVSAVIIIGCLVGLVLFAIVMRHLCCDRADSLPITQPKPNKNTGKISQGYKDIFKDSLSSVHEQESALTASGRAVLSGSSDNHVYNIN